MGTVLRYFREHRWQRRLLTFNLTIVVALAAGVVGYPYVRQHLLLRALAADQAERRDKAIVEAVLLARRSPRFVARIERALDSDDDRQFVAVATVLRQLGRFGPAQRTPLHIDRMRALEIAQTRSARDPAGAAVTRKMLLVGVLLSGRDNRYVRQALRVSATDDDAAVRRVAAVIAARLGDDEALKVLLGDADPLVSATAAVDAALAGRSALVPSLARLLEDSTDAEIVSSAAYGLAILDPKRYSKRICEKLKTANDPALRSRLLHVATILADQNARQAVREILIDATSRGQLATAAAVVAAWKLNVSEGVEAIRAIVADAAGQDAQVRLSQALAGFEAAWRWPINVDAEANAFCRMRWGPQMSAALIAAARALGANRDDASGVMFDEKVRTLRQAAVYEYATTRPSGEPAERIVTPVPSAAAAVALWQLEADLADLHVRDVAGRETTLPGDYVAWHLARISRRRAFRLGLSMLPPLRGDPSDAPTGPAPVYNANERTAGAMLLALAAEGEQEVRQARGRIESRLGGGKRIFGNFFERGAYDCALVILGDSARIETVRNLLATRDFPQRRAATALLAAGDRYVLDWLLWSPGRDEPDIAFFLINKALAEVLAACAPGLPGIDASASAETLHWQIRILCDAYAIRRQTVKVGLKR